MKFILTGVVHSLFKQGQSKSGPWFLYKIQTQSGKNTKIWTVFCSTQLGIGDTYELEGYVSESPNKSYTNQNGKHPYQASFNVKVASLIGMSGSKVFNDNEPPKINNTDEIPF